MRKKDVRVACVDCMKYSELRDFLDVNKYNIIKDMVHPDFVFYSNYASEHLKYKNCVKIFVNGENCAPDFNECDYSISDVKMTYADRCFWIPLAAQSKYDEMINKKLDDESLLNREFCSFIYSQSSLGEGAKLRTKFCEKLQKEYKFVACPGAVLHNVDAPELSARFDVANWHKKIEYLSRFKFNIAFENSDGPGYITEKLIDCYLAGVVPIYWGSCDDLSPFPKESMICAFDYPDLDTLIARVKEVDKNDELYLSILRANPLMNGVKYDYKEKCRRFVEKIIERGNKPFEKDTYVVSDTSRFIRASRGLNTIRLKCLWYAGVRILCWILGQKEMGFKYACRLRHARWSLWDIRNARQADATDPRLL